MVEQMFEHLKMNAKPAKHRYESMDGKEYLVAPTVMLVEGVHEGSDGALYYPSSVLSKQPGVWNHKPLVVFHPTMNGKGISACDPVVITKRSIGLIMNAKYDDKLEAEAWIDEKKSNKVDKRIVEAIKAGNMMEISTGLFAEKDKTEGTFNGKKYKSTVTSISPDHLAFLPEGEGACNIKAGCGCLHNKDGTVMNDASHRKLRTMIESAMRVKYGSDGGYWFGTIYDVYDDFFVYGTGYGDTLVLKRLTYKVKKKGIVLGETPEPVELVTEYRTADGVPIGNSAGTFLSEVIMDRKQKVDQLIANGSWPETERSFLMEVSEDRLNRMVPPPPIPVVGNTQTPVVPPVTTPVAVTPTPTPVPVENKQMTPQEYILNAPPGIREMLQDGLASQEMEKNNLIGVITGNSQNVFTKEYLATQPVPVLRAIAAVAAPVATAGQVQITRQPNFVGNGGNQPLPTAPVTQAPLLTPTMNYDAKK